MHEDNPPTFPSPMALLEALEAQQKAKANAVNEVEAFFEANKHKNLAHDQQLFRTLIDALGAAAGMKPEEVDGRRVWKEVIPRGPGGAVGFTVGPPPPFAMGRLAATPSEAPMARKRETVAFEPAIFKPRERRWVGYKAIDPLLPKRLMLPAGEASLFIVHTARVGSRYVVASHEGYDGRLFSTDGNTNGPVWDWPVVQILQEVEVLLELKAGATMAMNGVPIAPLLEVEVIS